MYNEYKMKKFLFFLGFTLIITILLPGILSNIPKVYSANGNSGQWQLIATDPVDHGYLDIKAVYYKVENNILFFKWEVYNAFSSWTDFDIGVIIDVDNNVNTGFDVDNSWYPNVNSDIGGEYLIIVGWEAYWYLNSPAVMFANSGTTGWETYSPIQVDNYSFDTASRTIVIGIKLSKFSGIEGTVSVFALEVAGNNWDYCPNVGNIEISVGDTLMKFTGVSTDGIAFLSIDSEKGKLKVFSYPSLEGFTPQIIEYDIKVISITRLSGSTIIEAKINYSSGQGDNWLPMKIFIDHTNGRIYVFGPIVMTGNL